MRIFELVDSDQQVLGLVKPILLRAKAEGASTVSMSQLLNDMDSEDNISPQMMVDILSRHRNSLKNIITSANLDAIELHGGPMSSMSTKADQKANKFNDVAVKQALDKLK